MVIFVHSEWENGWFLGFGILISSFFLFSFFAFNWGYASEEGIG